MTTTPYIPDDLPKTKTFSPDLQQAINQIYLWVKEGCPRHDNFSISVGLCSSIARVARWEFVEVSEHLFGENEFPFDDNWFAYDTCKNKYTNPKRLAWLQEHQTVE